LPEVLFKHAVNGRRTDLIALHNAGVPAEQLTSGVGWTPTLRTRIDNPRAVPGTAGPGPGAGEGS
jgi:pectate lyase